LIGIRRAKLSAMGGRGIAKVKAGKRAAWSAIVAGLVLSLAVSVAASQETVNLADVPGQPIDASWYRYGNAQYGIQADIPAQGYVYELSEAGDELSLDSADGERSISVYGSQDVDPRLTGNELKLAFAALAAAQIDAMRLGGIEVTQEHIEPFWFEVSATDATYLYYQKGLVSEHCPTLTANLWIKFPVEAQSTFDEVAKRMSQSLTIECAAQ
jgi:hypothetical protein